MKSLPTQLSVTLRSLDPVYVDFRVLTDGRHWLDLDQDTRIVVRPEDPELELAIDSLAKLAAAAAEMAQSLARASRSGAPSVAGVRTG